MKIKFLISAALIAIATANANAASDRNYYVVDSTVKQRFDVYNDGKNTYIEAIPGLVVRGATVDGSNYIVYGVPNTIAAHLNGRDITLTRGTPPKVETPVAMVTRQGAAAVGAPGATRGSRIGDGKAPLEAAPTAADAVVRNWSVKPAHLSLQHLMEDWAAKVGYEVIFKTRDFPLHVKSEKVISTGDFWAALTLLGESYRTSDAPFQIEPTDFKQIVVTPMNLPKAPVTQTNFEVQN